MTSQDWEEVKKLLSSQFRHVELECDGHVVTYELMRKSEYKLGIMTFVDGSFKGKWCDPKEEYPEQQFLYKKTRFLYSGETRKRMKKLSKREQKLIGIDPDIKCESYSPYWPNVKVLIRHLKKVCKEIRLLNPTSGTQREAAV